jgi:putative ABC transport system permease protein
MMTLEEQVNRATSHELVAVTLVALFGGLALLLASIGLYGVMSCTVSQSTRELGLRMALGAGASNVLRFVLSRGLLLTTTGIIIGIVLALLLTRLLGNLLYQESPRDPLAFAGIRDDGCCVDCSVFLARLACHANRCDARPPGGI